MILHRNLNIAFIIFFIKIVNVKSLQKETSRILTNRYNYSEVLRLSLLFYEAQRSGHLNNSRIPWRGDSALYDRGENNEDLTGGYYDAGDYIKFGFTIAFTTTMLSWGLLSYKQAYIESNQYENCLDAIKWATDYFIKCHVDKNTFYGQVGDFDVDQKYWGRPEDMNMISRPAFKIDPYHPASDLAGEVAAALSAASLVFSNVDSQYSLILLNHAKDLYSLALNYRGLLHEAIPNAAKYYRSSDYGDELSWAALWIYKATKDLFYLDEAQFHFLKFQLKKRPEEFNFNDKIAGVQVLLAEITRSSDYIKNVKDFCDFNLYRQVQTPMKLVFIDDWGTLSQAANVAYICMKAAELGISSNEYRNFARQQINYILGDSGRSYVIGFGVNWPTQPTHPASSCPNRPQKCTWANYKAKGPNPQILYGALVSGPDMNDFYMDIREEYIYNEVSINFNAGFQSCVAALKMEDILLRNEQGLNTNLNSTIQENSNRRFSLKKNSNLIHHEVLSVF